MDKRQWDSVVKVLDMLDRDRDKAGRLLARQRRDEVRSSKSTPR